MSESTASLLIRNELQILSDLVPLEGQRIIELGCGNARLARQLLQAYPTSQVTGLEVDARQHAKNLADPQEHLSFVAAGAQAVPFPDASFDLALMLKSLHHVPMPLLDQALSEVARVLRPGGHLYVSEPVYDGPLNEIVRLFNDEGVVRAAAQAAVDRALAQGPWQQVAERRFDMPVHYADFNEFEQRMMRPTYADHALTDELIGRVAVAFAPHCCPDGADFVRPMHVRLLRRMDESHG
ncbi:MAG: class I SAM-dependent methyltransferase [Aquabacterium sp.]|jgi:SAM-dependent methyltransferase|uniref:class I SAM-dependent methyltransferase n=1 Tax=Aquabacterium sp. TaxID=1872578 RepID=UPI001B4E01F9|nr:class I SAM-dependent methyltransferase [Aquabacterium sp.]MBP7131995.1 class I SAM-dependent methyltransferase [Aquabacterium sp.]MBP9063365.1 class I SAM-dependent methyltransferase [Aquabacterium sp.]MDQ5926066.1 Methyltransferase type 11 [Pseudomonadota bacterium]